jgi:hypothetical protein
MIAAAGCGITAVNLGRLTWTSFLCPCLCWSDWRSFPRWRDRSAPANGRVCSASGHTVPPSSWNVNELTDTHTLIDTMSVLRVIVVEGFWCAGSVRARHHS